MRLLVLGGTRFIGRALVEEALARGHDVTALHRGVTGRLPDGVDVRTADRTDPGALRRALGDDRWDAVVDTWAQAPRVVADAVEALAGRVEQYAYVSSRSVYRWPIPPGADETAPVVDATGADAELVWVDEADLEAAGARPWDQLPCWVPETGDLVGLMATRADAAHDAGLVCRPVEESVGDTWSWLQAEGWPAQRPDRPTVGLPPEVEAALLGAAH